MGSPADLSFIPVITIDGPTASGKGTIAQTLARNMGYHFLDSGALYRLTALSAELSCISLDDVPSLFNLAKNLDCRFVDGVVLLNGLVVTDEIRTVRIGQAASKIAAFHEVRQALFDIQLSFRQFPGLIADGRDMGTVIFPDAKTKIFLTANVEVRAVRRFKQLLATHPSTLLENVVIDLMIRDTRDFGRSAAPLKPDIDAHLLDTSKLSIDESINKINAWINNDAVKNK
jgi:cytidylate kinase